MYNIEISIDITSCKGYFLYWSFQKELLSKKKTKSYKKIVCGHIFDISCSSCRRGG